MARSEWIAGSEINEVKMRIGEVSRRSGVSARMLRHYESLGLVTPSARTSSGYREYSAVDIGRIFHIEGLRRLGLPLADVGRLLDDPGFNATRLVAGLIAASQERIAAEQALLARLEQIDRLGATDGEGLLAAIDLMRSLESRDVIQRHKAALGSRVDGTVPVETLVKAVLEESVLNAAGAMRWALAQSGAEAVSHLLPGLESPESSTRRRAVRALDEIARTTSATDLGTAAATLTDAMRAALTDDDPEVRALAAFSLGRVRDPDAVPVLLDIAMGGERDIDAAEVLAGYGAGDSEAPGGGQTTPGEWVMAELRRRATSVEPVVRFRVLQVLIELPGPASDELLTRLSDDDDREVAVTAETELNRRRGRSDLNRLRGRG